MGIQALASIAATCAAATGDVEVRRGGGTLWDPVHTGEVFRAGDWVRTKDPGYAQLELRSGGRIELETNSVVIIDLVPADAGVQAPLLAVQAGVVRGTMPEAGAVPIAIRSHDGSHLSLQPTGGPLEFRLTGDGTNTEVAVLQGEGRLVGAQGDQALGSGRVANVVGGELAHVGDLVSFPQSVEPTIDARFKAKDGLKIRLAWRRVKGAKSYRVEIARDLSMEKVEVLSETEETSFVFAPKQPGMYAWRIASRDPQGRYGEYGFVRRLFLDSAAPSPAAPAQKR